jgi:hypothetical protein
MRSEKPEMHFVQRGCNDETGEIGEGVIKVEEMKSKVIFDNDRSSLKVETDGELIALTLTLKNYLNGYNDTTIYLYQDELEKALEFVKEVNSRRKHKTK